VLKAVSAHFQLHIDLKSHSKHAVFARKPGARGAVASTEYKKLSSQKLEFKCWATISGKAVLITSVQ
jgi:hypothetical protein